MITAIGLDIGTSAAKALLVREDGRVIARAKRTYVIESPEIGAAELNPSVVLAAAESVIAEVAAVQRGTAASIGISSQGEAVVPVDKLGKPLGALQVSSDLRPAEVMAAVLSDMSADTMYQITGHTPAGLFSLFKLRWLAERRPHIHKAAWAFHCVEDLLHCRWGLDPAMGDSLAGRTMLFDVRKKAWDERLCALARIRPRQLARPLPCGSVVGSLGQRVTDELGLAKGCRVVAGGHDQCCAALGAGATEHGQAAYGCGTVECITPTFAREVFSSDLQSANLCTYPAAIAGNWASVAYSLTGGNALEWFQKVIGVPTVASLLAEMEDAPSPILALPYLTPSGTPWFDGLTPGALTGIRLDTTRGQLFQGLLEGIGYEMRLNLHLLQRSGLAVKTLRATGGGATDRRLCQLKADAIDRPLELLEEKESGCYGMAAAGIASLLGTKPAIIAKSWVRPDAIVEPRPIHRLKHLERFEAYRAQYEALRDLYSRFKTS